MLLTAAPSRWRTALVGALAVTASWLPNTVAEKTQADYFISSLPGQPEGPLLKMHAGYDGQVHRWLLRVLTT